MRYRFGFLCAVALGIVHAVGCGEDECTHPLSAYCTGAECPVYEDVSSSPIHGPTKCEDTWFVIAGRTIETGWVLYFDDSEALVAAEYFNYHYYMNDARCLRTFYGPVPNCPEEQFWM